MAVRILAFGDSLTEGWTNFGREFHPYSCKLHSLLQSICKSKSFNIVNRGISGETTDQMKTRLPRVLDKDGPFELVIILGGTNDLGYSFDKDGESLFQRLRSLHEMALKNQPTLPRRHNSFGRNEFIAQCENCLTKYWTINRNATKKKKLRLKVTVIIIIKNTIF